MNKKEFGIMLTTQMVCVFLFAGIGFALTGAKGMLLILMLGVMLTVIPAFFTYKRNKEIAGINDRLNRVLSGDNNLEVWDSEEGELSVLKANIYKANSVLISQRERLREEKLFLADAIADISHQLKTPLTSMMVMNDLLKNEDDSQRREEFIETQETQLERMNWLIQTLLKLSKLDAGTIVLKREEVSLKEIIEEAVKPFEIQFELRNINFKSDVEKLYIKGDKNWTVEAIQNIIKNCIEHMDDDGELAVSTVDTNIFTQVTIKDSGCGIAAEDIPHIFERFYKGKNAGKDSVGIGLALSKSIIEGEQGEITVESLEGEGTKFIIKFYKTLI